MRFIFQKGRLVLSALSTPMEMHVSISTTTTKQHGSGDGTSISSAIWTKWMTKPLLVDRRNSRQVQCQRYRYRLQTPPKHQVVQSSNDKNRVVRLQMIPILMVRYVMSK